MSHDRLSKYLSLILRHHPEVIGIGTAEKYTDSIEKTGLRPGNRMYVHFSPDIETAVTVGQRHGRPIVYKVKSGQMYRDGFCFYRSVNGVWLTLGVPEVYLERI